MSKKLMNEKEIEKARLERKWKTVIALVSAFNVKNTGGGLYSEEIELSCCFYLGEAELDHVLELHFNAKKPHVASNINSEELKEAYSYLVAASTASKKSKEKHPHFYQDSILLLSKYFFVVGEYKRCVEHMNSLDQMNLEDLSKRSKIILAEALTCKGLALERLQLDKSNSRDVFEAYERAGEIALSVCIEEERASTLKRTAIIHSHHSLTPLLETCLLRPGEIFTMDGSINDAVQKYRTVLRAIETKSTYNIRKTICRRLAELLLGFTSPLIYHPPSMLPLEDSNSRSGSVTITTPTRSSPDILNSSSSLKTTKRSSTIVMENAFIPNDEMEESVLLLLLSEAMITRNSGNKLNDSKDREVMVNETNTVFDLLVLALSRWDQYSLLYHTLEKNMKVVFDEYHLWFQFGLSLTCAGKHSRALLIFEQCHKLWPENTDVLLLCVNLCINNLGNYRTAISYSEKIFDHTTDDHVKANARLAIGICYSQLALKASSSGEKQNMLQLSLDSLQKACQLDSNDTEILFNLSFNQALSNQLHLALKTIEASLELDPTHLTSLYLLVLLLSAEKKYHEALDVLETAIEEYPHEFGLHLVKVKLTEACNGSPAALIVCHNMLQLWSSLCNTTKTVNYDLELPAEVGKSPSFSMSLPKQTLSDTKLIETTASFKKISLPDGVSMNDDDGTGSIAASVRFEKALSEAASGMTTTSTTYNVSTAIALLSKLWLVTAECFINMGDTTEASGCILESSAIFPLSPDVLCMRGRLNELQNNMMEARACYESSLSVLPTHRVALQRLGMIYHVDGDFALAEKTLRACILQDSSNPTAWSDLGLILESTGCHDEAAQCFFTSLKLDMTAPIMPYTTIPHTFRAFDVLN